MDIKWKNKLNLKKASKSGNETEVKAAAKDNHTIAMLLILVICIISAGLAVSMYPLVGRKAGQYGYQSVEAYEEDAISSISTQLMNGVYSLWMEQEQQKAGHLMTPTQIFIPDLNEKLMEARQNSLLQQRYDMGEEYYLELQSFMDSRGGSWKTNFSGMLADLQYQVLDKDGKIMKEGPHADKNYQIYTELSYDSAGNMMVTYTEDVPDGSEADRLSRELSAALNRYRGHDPLEEAYGTQYAYSGVTFQGPHDLVYKFWLPAQLFTRQTFDSGDISISSVQYSGALHLLIFFWIFMIAGFALILPCIKSFGLGHEPVFRVPFEIVSMVAFAAIIIVGEGMLPAAMVSATMNGLLAKELEVLTFADARSLVYVINIVVWAIALLTVYWVVTCCRAVFSLGLWRYFKERTLIGLFCRWLKKLWNRFYVSMQRVEFSQKPTRVIGKVVLVNFLVLTLICCFWFAGIFALIVYSVLLFFVLHKYWLNMQMKYERLLDAFKLVAGGNFDARIDGELGIFEPFRAELRTIQEGLKQAVDREVKSRKLKNELITNVSHDLKTPLTAIITYVNLLKNETLDEAERMSYTAVLEQKSMRLKELIEDLFEVSKANSDNIVLHPEPVDVVNLMKQVRHELSDRLAREDLEYRWNLPKEKKILLLDGQKTCRIFENLLINISKYAMPGTRAYIDMEEQNDRLLIIMRNISAAELHVSGRELTERLVRGDESRNTEGSGLGLAIALSFTEAQGGSLVVEAEADLFRVTLSWPMK